MNMTLKSIFQVDERVYHLYCFMPYANDVQLKGGKALIWLMIQGDLHIHNFYDRQTDNSLNRFAKYE